MLIVALTGSIGMGKSTAAGRFREHGIPVCDADALVHELYRGKATPKIESAFPGTTKDGVVDREKLSKALQQDDGRFARLEQIVHPLVREAEREFLATAKSEGHSLAILEIPLLFETGADASVDLTVVVSAGPNEQRRRVLKRPNMTEDKLKTILSRQMPDTEKRERADFVVDTSGSHDETADQVDAIVRRLRIDGVEPQAYHRHWQPV